MDIVYRFRLSEESEFVWAVDVEGPPRQNSGDHADWTRLENNQCKNCPLDSAEHEYCPAALDIEGVAEAFVDTVSYDRVDVRVETENRTYEKNCDFQEAIRSLFGLLMSTSACPVLARLKPMAHSHLPFSTLQETIQRMTGLYLIKQRALHKRGEEPDWELKHIDTLYQELGLSYELVPVDEDFKQTDEWRSISPSRKVPAIRDGGVTLFESGAILQYLLDRYGAGSLSPPPGSEADAAHLAWLWFGEATLPRPLGIYRLLRGGDLVAKARERLQISFDSVEAELASREGDWLLGETFLAADVMVGHALLLCRNGGLLEGRAALEAYTDRLSARPACRIALDV